MKKKQSNLIFSRSILEHRNLVYRANPSHLPALVPFKDVQISLDETTDFFIRIYTPKNYHPDNPTLFYLPGTAFVAKQLNFTHMVCSHFAQSSGWQVIVLDHELAPEKKYPTGYKDAYHLFKVVLKHHKQYKINTDKVALGGYSSGGNFAVLMTIAAIKEKIPIWRQILISPQVDLSRSLNKYKNIENNDDDIPEGFVTWYLDLYIPPYMDRRDPALSPLWFDYSNLEKLPPTDVFVGEYDRFYGDAKSFKKILQKAENPVKLHVIPNVTHAYWWQNLKLIEEIALYFKQLNISLDKRLKFPVSTEALQDSLLTFFSKKNEKNKDEHEILSPFIMSKL